MAFTATLELTEKVAKITLTGDLDAKTAPEFQAEVKKASESGLKKLALIMTNLDYMASAGLRVLIFAKQKMGTAADIYIIGAQELVLDTLVKTGYDQSVILLKSYDAAEIEK